MEENLKATPGDWSYRKAHDKKYNQEVYEIDAGDHTECIMTVWDAVDEEEQLANAKLAVGAKGILSALKELHNLLEEHQPQWYLRKHYNQSIKAIEYATV